MLFIPQHHGYGRFFRHFPLLLACAVLHIPRLSCAGEPAWTNQAGHRLVATPVSLHGETIEFQLPDPTKTVRYPLSVFPPDEQIRIKQALGIPHIPDELKSAYEYAAQNIRRLQLLHQKGKVDRAQYQADKNGILQYFRDQAAPVITQNILTETQLDSIIRHLESE